jgi:hypothetical protein
MRRATTLCLGVLVVSAVLATAGCRKAKPPQAQAATGQVTQPGPPPPPAGGGGGGAPINPAGMDVRRKIDEAVAYNQLYQIARFYNLYATENSRAPASQQELAEYLRRDAAKEYKSIQDGIFVIVPNARLASGVVVAYENEADRAGNHFVAYGDGAVQKMTTQQLQTALQNR